jgi:hypothetical protein
MSWTDHLDNNPSYRIAVDSLRHLSIDVFVYEKSICVAGAKRQDDQHFWNLDDFLRFCASKRNANRQDAPKTSGARASFDESSSDVARSLRARIVELEVELERVRDLGRRAVKERDEWKLRASEIDSSKNYVNGDQKYRQLRTFIAREFHPDSIPSDGIEKMIKSEIFKIIWKKINEIEK